jgi:spore coat polysaccharide biosynthesis protein SpsF
MPLIIRMIERVAVSPEIGTLVIATTTERSDDLLTELCLENNLNVFRGDTNDLLDRHYKAGLHYKADAIVKIPSDCPLIDPLIISKVIKYYSDNFPKFDYVSNLHPATFPDGNDVEIMSMESLKEAWLNAKLSFEREHTTPYLWENPDKFKIGNIVWETGLDYSMTHRWTIDYIEDYKFIKAVYDELYHKNPIFNIDDILELLAEKPEIKMINEKYNGVNWYRHHLDELKTVTAEQTRLI